MRPFTFASLFLVPGPIFGVYSTALKTVRGKTPAYPHDPNTTKYCAYWWDNEGSIPCTLMPDTWSILLGDFLRWNPSITPTCENFVTGKSYCVEASGEVTITLASPPSIGTTTSPATTGMATNCNRFHFVQKDQTCTDIAALYSITTAQFIQYNPAVRAEYTGLWASIPGMVDYCNKFYYVKPGDTCDSIAFWNGVPGTQWVKLWNNLAKDCRSLQADTYACIGVIGGTPTPTTTTRGNGIVTPTPTQSGMVNNCKRFTYVRAGDTCDSIASGNGVSTANFIL
ncbi:LysM domain-containing protein [Chaetomium strumarium]|uniref:LysM domain-containing protein n=1 Tax=Chaetomium strumarium TaxID=1170767 RepID=A0AAJ0GN46_9PEZI|nr:LysM domain-containing protein [Chaetomium strumarium]